MIALWVGTSGSNDCVSSDIDSYSLSTPVKSSSLSNCAVWMSLSSTPVFYSSCSGSGTVILYSTPSLES